VRAGTLRHLVMIQQKPAVTQNAFGEEVPGWSVVATVWARVETLTGREFVAQGQAQAEVTHKVHLRYRPGLEPTMRLVWQPQGDVPERVLEIEAVLDDGARREMTLMCREGV